MFGLASMVALLLVNFSLGAQVKAAAFDPIANTDPLLGQAKSGNNQNNGHGPRLVKRTSAEYHGVADQSAPASR